jgi:uncharacterized protein (DUF58 family)
MTRRGRLALALGGATYLAAWAFGSTALYPVALGLPAAVLLGWVWTRAANQPLGLRRTLSGGDRLEGDDVEVGLELAGEQPLIPARWVLKERVGRLGERTTQLGHGHSSYLLERLPRGRYAFEDSRAVIEDPFGLQRVEQPLAAPGAILVSSRSRASAPTTDGGSCCGGRPGSTCTASATTSTGTPCARCTGARPRGAAS